MATFVLLMLQPRPVSISLDVVILFLVGVLLLTMAMRDLPAPRFTASARTSLTGRMRPPPLGPLPGLDEILSALPVLAALVSSDCQPLSINAEATHWLEADCPSHLASPLRGLVRRAHFCTQYARKGCHLHFPSAYRPLAWPAWLAAKHELLIAV